MLLVLQDDANRENAYGPTEGLPDTKVGTPTLTLYEEADRKHKSGGKFVIRIPKFWADR